MPSPFLYFADDRLSRAELTAARLDGDVVELGDAFLPADAVETPALRAGSLSGLLGSTLAATHLTAAWIHGGLWEPPARHTVQRAVTRRLHAVHDGRLVYRDPVVPRDDLELLGGVWVTSPARTVADLVRVPDAAHEQAARRMLTEHPATREEAIDLLTTRRGIPHKRAGIRMLERLPADQDDVTR